MNEALIKKSNKRAFLVLIGCCLLQFAGLGTVLNSSAFFFASVPADLGLSMASFALWITMYSVAAFLILPVIGNLFPKYDTRVLMTTAAVITGACIFLFSLCTQAWQFQVLGFVIGLSGGTLFLFPTPVLIGNWFEKKRGLMTGIAMTFSGIAGGVFPLLFSALAPSIGWRGNYVLNAVVFLVLVLPFTLFVFRYKPEQVGMVPYGHDFGTNGKGENVAINTPGVSVRTAAKSFAFILALVACGFMAFYGGFNSYMMAFAMSVGQTMIFGSLMMTALQIGYIVACPVMGGLADKFGAKMTGVTLIVIMIISFISFMIFHSSVALMITAFFFGSNNALVTVTGPLFVRELFGGRDYAKIYSYASMAVGLIGGLGVTIIGVFYDATGGYNGGFTAGIIAALVILLAMFLASSLGKKLVWEGLDKKAAVES